MLLPIVVVFCDKLAVLRWISVFTVVSYIPVVQLGEELEHIKVEIEERGNSMADGGNTMEMFLHVFS